MVNTLKYIGLTITLLFIGSLIQEYFFEWSFSQLKNEPVRIINRTISGSFHTRIFFVLSIGVIPLLYLIVKKITKLSFINQGLIACGIILISGFLFWQLRIFQLNRRLEKLPKQDIETQISMDSLNFEQYLFIGLVVGTILSILIFKNKNKTAMK